MDHPQPEHLLGHQEGTDVLRWLDQASRDANPLRIARGFTLIELLVTMVLLGMLTTLALPSFTTWIQNTRVRSVAEALQNGVRTAQAEAVRRNRPVVMTFTNDANPMLDPNAAVSGKNWSMQTVASPFINNNVAEFIRSGVLTDVASGVSIGGVVTGASTPVDAVCFNANGRLMASTGTAATANCLGSPMTFAIAQSSSDRPLRVTVSVGGQVRMCDPNRPALSSTSPDGC